MPRHDHSNEENYPTPYVATVSKILQSGWVTIIGNSAPSVEKAQENLEATRREYYESGGWGGPG